MSTETVEQPQSLAEYKAERLNPPEPKEEPKAEVVEEAKEPETEPEKEEKKPKNKLTERFSELTTQRNAERTAREAAEARATAAEAKLAEAEGKKATPKVDSEVGPKPKKEEYADPFEYAEDLAAWSAEKALKDDRAEQKKAAEEEKRGAVIKAWQTRLTAAKEEIKDFDEVTASSQAAFSDLVKETIIESDFGPQLLYHFAGDDDEVDKLNKMTGKEAIKYLAKLEAKFEAKAEPIEPAKEVKAEKEERKRPPEPIKPIRASSVATNPITDNGEFNGSYQEWKALRQKGR